MDRTEVNASPVQKALQGIKKYKYVLLTALLGVLLLLLPQVLHGGEGLGKDEGLLRRLAR